MQAELQQSFHSTARILMKKKRSLNLRYHIVAFCFGDAVNSIHRRKIVPMPSLVCENVKIYVFFH